MEKEEKVKSKIFQEYSEPKHNKEEERVTYAHRFAENAKKSLETFLEGMGEEYDETVEMGKYFYHYLENKLHLRERTTPPTKEEVKQAIEQLKDMGRVGVFASISIIPGGGLSLLGLEVLARKLGINNFSFIPSAFRKRLYKNYAQNNNKEKNK
jgi:hypothetical protein